MIFTDMSLCTSTFSLLFLVVENKSMFHQLIKWFCFVQELQNSVAATLLLDSLCLHAVHGSEASKGLSSNTNWMSKRLLKNIGDDKDYSTLDSPLMSHKEECDHSIFTVTLYSKQYNAVSTSTPKSEVEVSTGSLHGVQSGAKT